MRENPDNPDIGVEKPRLGVEKPWPNHDRQGKNLDTRQMGRFALVLFLISDLSYSSSTHFSSE